MLKASFVRTIGERDRVYVTRSDGSTVNWVFATYGDAPPHDLIHLVVEAAFGVAQGFWGRIDAGVDPAAIMAEANKLGGANKFAGFGSDRSELLLAEILANPGWFMDDYSAATLREEIIASCTKANLPIPASLSIDHVATVRETLLELARQWKGLRPKGTLQLQFDATTANKSGTQPRAR